MYRLYEIDNYLEKVQVTLQILDRKEICKALEKLLWAITYQKTIYCFGNGGSASTASHFANDFNKVLNSKGEYNFQFICLNDNIATLTAIANDIGYDEVFRFQLLNRLKEGDVVIAISGSGNSKNVLNAVQYAKEHGATIIALTGFDGGDLKKIADINLHAPISNMQITEDVHLLFNHLLISILSKFLC